MLMGKDLRGALLSIASGRQERPGSACQRLSAWRKQTCSAAGVADLHCCLRCNASSLDLRMPEYCRVTLPPRDACWKSTAACPKPRAAQHLLSSEVTSLQHYKFQAIPLNTYVHVHTFTML